MKKNNFKIIFIFIFILCLSFPSIIRAQVIIDTLYLFPDTTNFIDEQNGFVLDWMANFAVKFNIPDEAESIIIKKVGFLIFNLGFTFTFNNYFKISVGNNPEETILYEKDVSIDSSTITFPEWQFYNIDSVVQIENDAINNSFFISGLIFLRTATTQMYDSLLLNHFIYHAYNEYWIEGVREYLPVKVVVERIISDVNKDYPEVNGYHLYQNYPNPFNPSTTILYSLKEISNIRLIVYNLLGEEVEVLIEGEYPSGNYKVSFNPTDIPAGIYFYSLITERKRITKKMIYLK